MNRRHVTWSATTCSFPGAGIYVGLAPSLEHAMLARRLTAKQVRVMTGGTMQNRPGDRPLALNYFAVRDPSAVTVKPLDVPPLSNGFKHVVLICRLGSSEPAGGAASAIAAANGSGMACFVMTIGLASEREDAFYRDIIGKHPETDWGEIFRRMGEMGCREAI